MVESAQHVWASRGSSPRYLRQDGFKNAYIFGATHPRSGRFVGLVASQCNGDWMELHLQEVSRTISQNSGAIVVLDQAGWHRCKGLVIPENIVLCFLPPYCPELNPVERLWLYLKRKNLSRQVYASLDEVIDAGVTACRHATRETVRSVCQTRHVEDAA